MKIEISGDSEIGSTILDHFVMKWRACKLIMTFPEFMTYCKDPHYGEVKYIYNADIEYPMPTRNSIIYVDELV